MRELVIRQGRDGNVERTGNPRVEHTAAPYGNIVSRTDVMNAFGFRQAADAGNFNIDRLAASQFNSLAGVFCRVNRFVQADARLHGLLQMAVVDNIVAGQRLFNHKQIVFIELFKDVHVFQRVCRIGVDHEHNVAKFLTYSLDIIDIHAGLALAFNAAIALFHVFFNGPAQIVRRCFDAQADACFNFCSRTA